MGTSRSRIRVGSFVLAAAATVTGTVAVAGPAEAVPDIPPQGCGLVHHEVGLLSATIHSLEPTLLPLGLAYFVHDLNCNYVINIEYLLGLQKRPQFPF